MALSIDCNKKDDVFFVSITGPLNEGIGSELNKLLDQPVGNYVVDLSGVEYINSVGVRAWVNFIRSMSQQRELSFSNVSPDVIDQLNMIPGFLAELKVSSCYALFSCAKCGHTNKRLFEELDSIEKLAERCEGVSCDKCQGGMELEDDPWEYFGFLEY